MKRLKTTRKARRKKSIKIIRGTPLTYNAGLQVKYVRELRALIRKMTKATQKATVRLFKGDAAKEFFAEDASVASQARIVFNELIARFDQLFGRKAKTLTEQMIDKSGKVSNVALNASLKKISENLVIKNNLMTPALREMTKAAVAENVNLIKSIPSEYLGRVKSTVLRSITNGNGLEYLIPRIKKYDGMTERRAKNLALDQTRKIYSAINAQRMQKVGIRKFEWLHSGGADEPRPDHVAMSGNIYSFDDPPVIDQETGERGLPGQIYNCGCIAVPVIEYDEEETE